jgi:hypothetical protein
MNREEQIDKLIECGFRVESILEGHITSRVLTITHNEEEIYKNKHHINFEIKDFFIKFCLAWMRDKKLNDLVI